MDFDGEEVVHNYIPPRIILATLPYAWIRTERHGRIDLSTQDPNMPLATGNNQLQMIVFLEAAGADLENARIIRPGLASTAATLDFILSQIGWHPYFQDLVPLHMHSSKSKDDLLKETYRRILRIGWFNAQVETKHVKWGNNRSTQNTNHLLSETDGDDSDIKTPPQADFSAAFALFMKDKLSNLTLAYENQPILTDIVAETIMTLVLGTHFPAELWTKDTITRIEEIFISTNPDKGLEVMKAILQNKHTTYTLHTINACIQSLKTASEFYKRMRH